jgi:hypothetical protein
VQSLGDLNRVGDDGAAGDRIDSGAQNSQKLRDELMEALEMVDSNRVKILDNDFNSNLGSHH